MAPLVIPPIKTPIAHPRTQPIVLPPQLDPSCVLCLLPIRDTQWRDFSGKGNHGTINGASWTSKGRLGPVLIFDGLDDYVDCGNVLNMAISDFSIEAWVNFLNNTAYAFLVGSGGGGAVGYALAVNPDGYPYLDIKATTQTRTPSTDAIDDGEWHSVVATLDRDGYGKIYIDGEFKVKVDISAESGDISTAYNLTIGRWAGGNYNPLDGMIDEVRVYNRVLTVDEINVLYEQGR